MLEKAPTKPVPKRPRKCLQAETKTEVINEPKSDWVHPWEAPFYCFPDGYIRSAQAWTRALQAEVQRHIEYEQRVQPKSRLTGEWSFDGESDSPRAWITAMGIQTTIAPVFLSMRPWDREGPSFRSEPDLERWFVCDYGKEILAEEVWKDVFAFFEIDPQEKLALQWHLCLLRHLFSSWEHNFVKAIRVGTAHIVARKQSVLAPFERITWNQWRYFQPDPTLPGPRDQEWGDARGLQDLHRGDQPWTATGPAGEKLYDVYIAPGACNVLHDGLAPEQRVIEWLVNLLREYPDEPPQSLPELSSLVRSHFPGLSIKGFDHCYLTACERTHNFSWSKPGRRKSLRKPVQAP